MDASKICAYSKGHRAFSRPGGSWRPLAVLGLPPGSK